MQSLPLLPTIDRSLEAQRAHDVSQFAAAPGALALRVALGTCMGSSVFLSAYMLLHALHVAELDFWRVSPLSSIPLFATIQASALPGLLTGSLTALLATEPQTALAKFPRLLAMLTVLFVLEVVAFP